MKGTLVSLLSAAALLTGCSGLHYFDLKLQPEPPQVRIDGIIRVDETHSNETYWTRNMVLRKEPFKVEHFFNNRWAENPENLIRNVAILFYRNSGCFTRVIDRHSSVEADISLKITVYAIEMVKDPDGWNARLALDLEFSDPRVEQVILVHTFDRKERIRSRKPEYLAETVSLILKQELLKAAEKTAAVFSRTPPPGH